MVRDLSARPIGELAVVPAVPELPEVETVRRQLEPELVGRSIVEAGSLDSPKFASARGSVGARFRAMSRRGKYLISTLDGLDERDHLGAPSELIVHLGMTGVLSRWERPSEDPYVRAWWALDDDSMLELRDVRRFGRVHLVVAGDYARIPTLRDQGPEPLSDAFTPHGLYEALRRSRRTVKTQLLSQRPVAGVGNIYADEALWLARIRPTTRRIGEARAAELHGAIRSVLHSALDHGGTTLRDYRDAYGESGSNQHHLLCYGRAGDGCARCGSTLRSGVVDARGTTWCPTCQAR